MSNLNDKAKASESLIIARYDPRVQNFDQWNEAQVRAQIARFEDESAFCAFRAGDHGAKPYDVSRFGYMTLAEGLLVNNGGNFLVKLLRESSAAAGGNPDTTIFYDNTNARIGIGDSTTAAAVTQTDLQAATNKTRIAMDTGFPKIAAEQYTNLNNGTTTISDRQIVFSSIASSGVANYAWQEFGIFNSATADTGMLDRFVSDQGTKVSGQVWVVWITLTWS